MPSGDGTGFASPRDRRQSERHAIEVPVPLRLLLPGLDLSCRATDISLHGMRIQVDRPVAAAGQVELRHPSAGAFAGQLAWRGPDALGIVFDTAEEDLAHCLQCVSLLLSPGASPEHLLEEALPSAERRRRFRLRATLAAHQARRRAGLLALRTAAMPGTRAQAARFSADESLPPEV